MWGGIMRVIEIHQEEETKVTCENCRSIYAYNKHDIRDTSFSDIAFSVERTGVKCPVCGFQHVIDSKVI